MKKLLLIAAMALCAALAHAQGTVQFLNSSGTAITNSVTGVRAANTGPGSVSVGIWYAPTAGQPADSLTFAAGSTSALFAPGLFNGGTKTITGVPAGSTISLQVRAWESSFADYALAFAGGGLVGSSSVLTVTTGGLTPGGTTLPAPTLVGSGLNAFTVQPIPEPSSIALGLLGLGAVALFRRRK